MIALWVAVTALAGPGLRGTVVVTNMNDNTATVIDAATNRVLATLPTGEAPHEVTISHDGRTALVTNYGVRGKPGNTLTVLDLEHLAVARTIDLGRYQRPHGIAFFRGDTMAVITAQGDKAVLLLDLRTDKVVATAPTDGALSHMLALVPDGRRVFTTNLGDNTVTEIDPAARRAVRTFPVGKQPEGIAVAPDGRTVWSGSNGDSIVVVLDVASARADTIRGFGRPYRMAVTPDGKRAVVTDPERSEIRIINAATKKAEHLIKVAADSLMATTEVPGSASPEGVTVAPDSRHAFVTLQGRNRMVTIDLVAGTIVGWAVTGTWSDGIAFTARVVDRGGASRP